MADTIVKHVLQNDKTIYRLHAHGLSDGTAATNILVDRSTLLASDGAEPSRLDLAQIRWSIQGYTQVILTFDHTTDDVLMRLANNGYEDFSAMGAPNSLGAGFFGTNLLQDPASAGGTGDLLITTVGTTSGASFDLTLALRLVR